MARTIVPCPDGVWTELGTGQMVVTMHRDGDGKGLGLNNSETEASALLIPKGRTGDQFFNNNPDDTISAFAYGDGWELAVDDE